MAAMDFNEAFATRKRILQKLQIDHIAAVDKPANEHALAVIMKNVSTSKGDTMSDFAKAEADFETCVERIQKRDGSTRFEAMMKATNEHPDEWSHYRRTAKPVETKISKAVDTLAKHDEMLADLVRKEQRSGETFAKAYDRVLREQPHLYTGRKELARSLVA